MGGGAACDDTDPGGDRCAEASECNVECKCENGSVTTGSCGGGTCASADDVCPEACEAFPANGDWTDTFCFIGTEGGGAGGAGGMG
ncbi:MAG: hypothetical protein H6702_24875, partial [Myxococcales bacterium]|nr:hypothetical protein [Myxococcales bacterium]